jgi:hypothetical protein
MKRENGDAKPGLRASCMNAGVGGGARLTESVTIGDWRGI